MLSEPIAFNLHPLIAIFQLAQEIFEKLMDFLPNGMCRIPALKEEIAEMFTLNTRTIPIATNDIKEVEVEAAAGVGMEAIADIEAGVEAGAEAETEANLEVRLEEIGIGIIITINMIDLSTK